MIYPCTLSDLRSGTIALGDDLVHKLVKLLTELGIGDNSITWFISW